MAGVRQREQRAGPRRVLATDRVERNGVLGIVRRLRARNRYVRESRMADVLGTHGRSGLHRSLFSRYREHRDGHFGRSGGDGDVGLVCRRWRLEGVRVERGDWRGAVVVRRSDRTRITFVWSSPAVFGNSVYIGVASFGDCPLVQGQLLQLDRITGALQHTFNVVPNGCTGGGVWGSPTIDAAAGTIYFDHGQRRRLHEQRTARPGDGRSARLRPEPGGLVGGAPRAAGRRQRLRVDTDVVQRCHRRTVAASCRCDQQERHLLRVRAGRARVGTCLEHPDRDRRR